MPRGKRVKESEALKTAFAAYKELSSEEQTAFRNKAFTSMLAGLSLENKMKFREYREQLLSDLGKQKDLQEKIEALSEVPTEVLQAVLEKR